MLPELPYELLQEILHIAARSSTQDASELLTLSKWVYQWLIPITYEIVIISTTIYRPPQIYHKANLRLQIHGKHVRSLLIDISPEPSDITVYLQSCPNVTNLGLWTSNITPEHVHILEMMPLRRLSIETSLELPDQPKFNPSSLAFQSLTHLDLIHAHTWESWEILAKMPNLTHLGLDEAQTGCALTVGALKHCKRLKVLVLIGGGSVDEVAQYLGFGYGDHDCRVVPLACRFLQNWERGAEGKKDIWEFAEEVIAQQLAGKEIEI